MRRIRTLVMTPISALLVVGVVALASAAILRDTSQDAAPSVNEHYDLYGELLRDHGRFTTYVVPADPSSEGSGSSVTGEEQENINRSQRAINIEALTEFTQTLEDEDEILSSAFFHVGFNYYANAYDWGDAESVEMAVRAFTNALLVQPCDNTEGCSEGSIAKSIALESALLLKSLIDEQRQQQERSEQSQEQQGVVPAPEPVTPTPEPIETTSGSAGEEIELDGLPVLPPGAKQ